jgi:hypothetical protein
MSALSTPGMYFVIPLILDQAVPRFRLTNLSFFSTDVYIRGVYGSIVDSPVAKEGRELHGDDECIDAAS